MIFTKAHALKHGLGKSVRIVAAAKLEAGLAAYYGIARHRIEQRVELILTSISRGHSHHVGRDQYYRILLSVLARCGC